VLEFVGFVDCLDHTGMATMSQQEDSMISPRNRNSPRSKSPGVNNKPPPAGSSEDFLLTSLKTYLKTGDRNATGLTEILEQLLRSGGDDRLVMDPATGMNKYHTPIRPCEGVHRSSCTSNVPTQGAFDRGLDILRRLVMELRALEQQVSGTYSSPEDLFAWLLRDVRERLRSIFHLSLKDSISLFPSGTDAELMPALLAIARCLSTLAAPQGKPPVTPRVFSLVTAAGEVGSGTRNAAMGLHFSKLLPSGRKVAQCGKEARVFDIPDNTFVAHEMPIRSDDGTCRPPVDLDSDVEELVQRALETGDGQGRFDCAVVHMVVGSKTGQCVPSSECMDRLAAKYENRIVAIVDACQGRMGEFAVREHLDKGRVVLTTGSKFFGGAPFSGVCIMPVALARELEMLLSEPLVSDVLRGGGLNEYVVASLLSDDLPSLCELVSKTPLNYGALLRWTLALHEMEAFFVDMLASERDEIMRAWTSKVREIVVNQGGALVQLVDDSYLRAPSGASNDAAALSTIICFECRCLRSLGGKAEPMTMDELRRVQCLMAMDLHAAYPDLRLFGAAQSRCFMGQPVCLNPASPGNKINILRVAASAPLVVEINRHGIEHALTQDGHLFEKLHLILANWKMFERPSKM